MIDTHSHLNFKAFDKDLDSVVRRFKEEGGEALVVVGAKIDSSKKAIEIANKYESCFAAVGIHPHHLNSLPLEQADTEIRKLVLEKKVVAIGETGLDSYNYKNYPPTTEKELKLQHKFFEIHLNIACDNKLPVIIHCRNEYNYLLETLGNYLKNRCLNGVIHCFEGKNQQLDTLISYGFYIGFDGNITYPQNIRLRELIKNTPIERLLVETDAPYLTPLPFRGKRNEPSYLKYTLKEIADIKNVSYEEVEKITSENAKNLFVLKP